MINVRVAVVQRSCFFVVLLGMLLSLCAAQENSVTSPSEGPSGFRVDTYDSSFASLRQEFPKLQTVDIGGASLFYNAQLTTILGQRRSGLDAKHPLYSTNEFESDDFLFGLTRLRPDENDSFWVLFTWGPSVDPSFYFIPLHSPDSIVADLPGTALAIPGDGSLMTAGRFDNYYTRRRTYASLHNRIQEVPQPFSYIGLKTKSLVPILLYEGPRGGNTVCRIDGNTPIEVILTDDSIRVERKISVLVRTPGGLLGWAIFEPDQFTYTVIEGISWWGD